MHQRVWKLGKPIAGFVLVLCGLLSLIGCGEDEAAPGSAPGPGELPSIDVSGTLFVHPVDSLDGRNTRWGMAGGVTGATSASDGAANTAAIQRTFGAGDHAAGVCAALVAYGFDDWYLPARDELQAMHANATALGGFEPLFYWSSTEEDAGSAWVLNFGPGAQSAIDKGLQARVRCVRRGRPGAETSPSTPSGSEPTSSALASFRVLLQDFNEAAVETVGQSTAAVTGLAALIDELAAQGSRGFPVEEAPALDSALDALNGSVDNAFAALERMDRAEVALQYALTGAGVAGARPIIISVPAVIAVGLTIHGLHSFIQTLHGHAETMKQAREERDIAMQNLADAENVAKYNEANAAMVEAGQAALAELNAQVVSTTVGVVEIPEKGQLVIDGLSAGFSYVAANLPCGQPQQEQECRIAFGDASGRDPIDVPAGTTTVVVVQDNVARMVFADLEIAHGERVEVEATPVPVADALPQDVVPDESSAPAPSTPISTAAPTPGTSGGDPLQSVDHVLSHVSLSNGVASRMGNDDFTVLCFNYLGLCPSVSTVLPEDLLDFYIEFPGVSTGSFTEANTSSIRFHLDEPSGNFGEPFSFFEAGADLPETRLTITVNEYSDTRVAGSFTAEASCACSPPRSARIGSGTFSANFD